MRHALLMCIVVPVLLAGCFKFDQEVVVMPNGSGRLTFTIGQNVKAVKQAMGEMFGGQSPEQDSSPISQDIEKVRERCEGLVAFGEAERWEEDGWEYARFNAWFDDINQVKLYEEVDEEGKQALQVSYSWKPGEDGHVFVRQGSMAEDMKVKGMGEGDDQMPADNPFAKQIQALMTKLLVDASFVERFTLPGMIASADAPLIAEGRSARTELTGEQMFDPEHQKDLASQGALKVICGESQVTAEQEAAFAAELAQAKVAWSERLAKLEEEKAAQEAEEAAARKARDEALADGKATWIDNLDGVKLPARPGTGMLHGQEFVIEKASIQNGILELREGGEFFADRGVVIFLFLDDGVDLDGLSIALDADGKGSQGPTCHVHMKYKVEGESMPKTEMFMDGIGLRLEFGKRQDDVLPGKIYLCLPDDGKSVVVGSFKATME